MVLHGLQSLLGRLYDVEMGYDVYDFLVTDRRALSGVTPGQRSARAGRGAAARRDAGRRGRRAVHRPERAARAWSKPIRSERLPRATSPTIARRSKASAISSIRLGGSAAMRRCRCWSSRPRPRWTSTPPRFFSRRSAGRRLSGAGACAAFRSRGIRPAAGAGAVRALSDGAPLRGQFLPEPGEALREPRRRAGSRRWCGSCANSTGWDTPRSSATRCPELAAAAAAPRRGSARGQFWSLLLAACFLSLSQSPSLRRSVFFGACDVAELAAVVRVVALHGAQGIRLHATRGRRRIVRQGKLADSRASSAGRWKSPARRRRWPRTTPRPHCRARRISRGRSASSADGDAAASGLPGLLGGLPEPPGGLPSHWEACPSRREACPSPLRRLGASSLTGRFLEFPVLMILFSPWDRQVKST